MVLLIIILYLVGIGFCRGVLSVVYDKLDIFEGSEFFWLIAIFWPFTAIPVAAWIFVEHSLNKR